MPFGTKSFDDPSLLMGHEKYAALSTPGVQKAEDMIVSFASWRKPEGGRKSFILVGLDWANGGTRPWSLDEGTVDDLNGPNAVAVDRSYFKDLGSRDAAIRRDQQSAHQVTAVTKGIRSFTTLPYVFTPINTARKFVGASAAQATYVLVTLQGRRCRGRSKSLQDRVQGAEVLTHDEFAAASTLVFSTGAGLALITGMVLNHRRRRYRRTDSLCQHQGPFERVRNAALRGASAAPFTPSSSFRRC